MRTLRIATLGVCLLALIGTGRADDEGYLLYPAIAGDRVVFTAEGDLWVAPVEGGTARRLTRHAGLEAFARISPDGRWIAFSAEYAGNQDIYRIPLEGGAPRRLTFHPSADQPVAWRPDGSAVVFRSPRLSPHRHWRLFAVPPGGGLPRLLPLDRAARIAFRPDGKTVAFNRRSREFRHWKRYRGGLQEDIWVGDLEEGEFRRITDFPGTDAFPMWHGDRIYFLSDRDDTANIWSVRPDGSDARQHTHHKTFDVRWPSIGGRRIVYMHAGGLRILDLRDGSDRPIPLRLPSDRRRTLPRYVKPTDFLSDFALAPDGKRLLLGIRGDVFTVPVKEGRTIAVARTQGVREKFPAYGPRATRVAVFSDRSGEEELLVLDAFGKKPPTELPSGKRGWHFRPVWSPDGAKIAFADMEFALYVVRVDAKVCRRVDRSDTWEIRDYVWSPDSRWLAYARPEANRFTSIFLVDTEAEGDAIRPVRITGPETADFSPVFDPAGRMLFFLSNRTYNPLLGALDFETILDRMTRPYLVLLRAGDRSPFVPREPEDPAPAKPSKEKDAKPVPVQVRIDADGIEERVVEVPVPAGRYSRLGAIRDSLFYLASPTRGLREGDAWRPGGKRPGMELRAYDLKKREERVYAEDVQGYALSGDGKRIVVRRGGQFYPGDPRGSLESKAIDLGDVRVRIEPRSEWRQIFREAWRLHRDFYWAADMAGNDWEAIRRRYEPLLDRIATRAELNDLLGEMIAELGTSHTYISGGDAERAERVPVGLLGADLEPDPEKGGFRIARILGAPRGVRDAASPLAAPHLDIREGDVIVAVDGRPVEPDGNPYALLENRAKVEVLLTIQRGGDASSRRDAIVRPLASERDLRYLDWVERTRAWVDAHSDGTVGYIHIPDMGGSGLAAFARSFYHQLEKKGLIIDTRFNRGGFVSQLIIARLEREIWAFMRPRRGKPDTYPERAARGHMVAICNGPTGSDGDIFCQSFQILGLGPVVGVPTWGGVIGIRGGKPFVDGGQTMIPEFAWWSPQTGWDLENRGVIPDVRVDNPPGRAARGIDDQLEKALEIVLDRIRREPKELPSPPPVPRKGKGAKRPRGGRL